MENINKKKKRDLKQDFQKFLSFIKDKKIKNIQY